MDNEEVKVSELPEASEMNDEDLLMIIQNEANKSLSKEKLFKSFFEVVEEW